MKNVSVLAFIILTAMMACGPTVEHPHVHTPIDTPKCADACKHLQDLGCDEGKTLPDGTTCQSFCESTQNSGHALTPSCVIHINRCADMDALDAFCPAGYQR